MSNVNYRRFDYFNKSNKILVISDIFELGREIILLNIILRN